MLQHVSRWTLPVLFLLASCAEAPTGREATDLPAETTAETEAGAPKDLIRDILQRIPEPVESAARLQEIGGRYYSKLALDPKLADQIESPTQKALALGMYGSDLGYATLNNQTQDAVFYLNAVQRLSENLRLAHLVDFNKLHQLSGNASRLDSLLLHSTQSMQRIDTYLQDQDRGEQSLLIITGGWIEGLHLLSQIAVQSANPKLSEKLGEQKIVLLELNKLLRYYANRPSYATLMAGIKQLNAVYQDVIITETANAEPHMETVRGVATMVGGPSSQVTITPAQISAIVSEAAKLRNNLLQR